MSESKDASLYSRLGGYDAIAAVADALLKRLMSDSQLARFWRDRAADSVAREKQLLIEFLSSSAGGPVYYMGRTMSVSHKGMGISESDWSLFIGHLKATLAQFSVPERECNDVLGFVDSLKKDIVEK